jgi:hypothetical protein
MYHPKKGQRRGPLRSLLARSGESDFPFLSLGGVATCGAWIAAVGTGRNWCTCNLVVIVCSKEVNLHQPIIDCSELGGFDPFADTFADGRISYVGLFEEVENRVESLYAAGARRDLYPPKNVHEFPSRVKFNARVKANATVRDRPFVCSHLQHMRTLPSQQIYGHKK